MYVFTIVALKDRLLLMAEGTWSRVITTEKGTKWKNKAVLPHHPHPEGKEICAWQSYAV